MTGQNQAVVSTFGVRRTILLVLLFVGLLSLLSLYLGFDEYLSNNPGRAALYLLMGTTGFALIGYMFFRSQSVMQNVGSIPQIEVSTSLECKNCGLKKIRPFQRGDSLFVEAEECTRCHNKMVVERVFGKEKTKPR